MKVIISLSKRSIKNLIFFFTLIVIISLIITATTQVLFCQNYFELPVKNFNLDTIYCSKSRSDFVLDMLNNYNNFENIPCTENKPHTGKDIGGVYGQPILACGDGYVEMVYPESMGGLGRTVILRHDLKVGKIYSLYAHLKSIELNVYKDAKIYKGQRIATMGGSHNCNDDPNHNHLHLEFRTNPDSYLCRSNCSDGNCGYLTSSIFRSPDDFIKTSPYDVGIEYIPHEDGCNFQKRDLGYVYQVLETEPNDVHDQYGNSYSIDLIKNYQKSDQTRLLRDQELELLGKTFNGAATYVNVQGNFKPTGDLDIYSFDASLAGTYGIALKYLEIDIILKVYEKQNGIFDMVVGPIEINANIGSGASDTNFFCKSGGKYYLEITPKNDEKQCNPYLLVVARAQEEKCPPNNFTHQENHSLARSFGFCADCADGIQNNDETGIDCGGEYCIACSCDINIESSSLQLNTQNSGYEFRGNLVSSSDTDEYTLVAYVNNEIVSYSQNYFKNGDNIYLGNIPCNENVVIRTLQVGSPGDCYAEVSVSTPSCTSSGPPNEQATEMKISYINTNQFYGTWSRGDGQKVIVTCTPCNLSATTPKNGVEYGANRDYSQAPNIGNSRIVYLGASDSRLIRGLSPNTCYRLRAYEYNGIGSNAAYLLSNPPTASATTSDVLSLDFDWDPNPIVVGQRIDFDWISSLGGLSTEEWTFQGGFPSNNNTNGCCATWSSPGTYRVTLEGWHASVDQRQTIFKDITVISINDFKPDIDLSINILNPTILSAGQEITVQWVAENIGYDYAKLTNSQYFLSRDQIIDNNDIELIQDNSYNYHGEILEFNEVFNWTKTLDLPNSIAYGNWYLLVKVNSEKALAADYPEDNFNNNIASIPFTIEEELPDLTLENVSVAKTTLRSGEQVNTNVNFVNRGYYNNFNCASYNIYLSTDNQLSEDDGLYYINNGSYCTNNIRSPNSPESHSRLITVNPVTPNGDYYLLFCMDRSLESEDNKIAELNEANNIVAIPVVISNPNQPTVQVSNFHISDVSSSSVTLNWTRGNGTYSMITATSEDSKRLPVDGNDYAANTNWDNAEGFYSPNPLTRFVYKGTSTQATVTNLSSDKTWYFTIYSYNGNGINTDYLQANAPTVLAHTRGGDGSNYSKHLVEEGLHHYSVDPIFEMVFSKNSDLVISFGSDGRLLRSLDKCISHQLIEPLPFKHAFYAGEIFDDNTLMGIDRDGAVFKNSDLGKTWTHISFIDSYTNIRMYDSHFINSQTGFVVASRSSDGAGLIYKTTNGGITWSRIYTAPSRFYHIDSNNSNIWASGRDGRIVRSYNLGETWSAVNNNLGSDESIGNIQFVTDLIGYCNTLTTIYKTIDGGSTWTAIRSLETVISERTLYFLNENVGFAIGAYANEAELLKTIDGGSTWTTVTDINFGTYSKLYAESESTVWLYGSHITKITTCTENTYYADNDNDGYGNSANFLVACRPPTGYVNNVLDCDDSNPNINPDAEEICDNLDNNCNNEIDDNITIQATSNLTASSLTANSATLSWDQIVEAESYILAYKTSGEADFTFVSVENNTYNLFGLLENTSYSWFVRVLGCASAISNWVRGDDFTTLSSSLICSVSTIECGNTYTGSTSGVSYYNPNNIFSHCGSGGLGAPNAFYKLQGNGQDISLELCGSDYDTRLSVYCLLTNSCSETANFVCVAGNDDLCSLQSGLTFWAKSGYDFYIMIHGFGLAVGNYSLAVSCNNHCTPVANADCSTNGTGHAATGQAQSLTLQANTSNPTYTFGDNSCTTIGRNPSCDPYGQIQDVWYKFNSGSKTTATIQTSLSASSPAGYVHFAVYDACSGADVICETSSGNLTVATMGNLLTNHVYYIQVWSRSSASGRFGIAVYAGNATAGCPALNTVTLNGNIPSDEYYAETRIYSSGIVSETGNVVMKAGSEIYLMPGFHSKGGSNFLAAIAPCSLSEITREEDTDIELPPTKPGENFRGETTLLQVHPNPLLNQATVRFYLPTAGVAKVLVFDINGQLLTEQVSESGEGWNSTQLDASRLPAGMYYVTLQTQNGRWTEKIMVTR